MSDNNIKEIVKEELNKDNRKFYIRVIFVMLAVIIVYYAISPIQNCKRDGNTTGWCTNSRAGNMSW